MFHAHTAEPMTAGGWTVLFWTGVVAMLALAGLTLFAAWRTAGWDDAPLASGECLRLAAVFAGAAIVAVVGRMAVRRLLDA